MWKRLDVWLCVLTVLAAGIPRSARTEEAPGKLRGGGNVSLTEPDDAEGTPTLETVSDAGAATAHLTWSNSAAPPCLFAGFAYDIYASDWVKRFWEGTPWCPFDDSATSGDMDLGFSGAYHIWISNQYASGGWYPCPNPWTGILYSGTPHTPSQVVATRQPYAANVRLHWQPDLYGTWCYQIALYKMGAGWVDTTGPGGTGLWHFVDYGGAGYSPGEASFLEGWADFTLPAGDYWLFVRGVGWLSSDAAGSYKTAWITTPGVFSFTLPGGVPLDMVPIPAGSFQMGSPDTERSRDESGNEGPVHTVNIPYTFYLGECEVTQGQWKAVTGNNPVQDWIDEGLPSMGFGDEYPVYFVSWEHCQSFAMALNDMGLGGTFRLPSEAEWEYACRAGTQTRFFFGDSLLDVNDGHQGDGETDGPAGTLPGKRSDYMWWGFNDTQNTNAEYGSGTHPVGTKLPNQWGLYDMSGNVWEWCQDWYHENYNGAPTDGSAWESPRGSSRECRGGDWSWRASLCRSASRYAGGPGPGTVGVRLAWTPD